MQQAPQKTEFRELCRRHGLAVTHQRAVIYQSLMSAPGHPSPEEVYAVVCKQIPSISLATVYKTLHTFVESGVLRELSLHHGSLRVDPVTEPHPHLVCTKCKAVFDLDEGALEAPHIIGKIPKGFRVQGISVELHGVCERCSRSASKQ
ncbi:MAG: Fur family transcriptional regulator [Terriglobia bacterium]|nr:Fur family transcriptional regulator [Terriglobia bacterium]